MRVRWLILLISLLPATAMAQTTVVTSLPRPAGFVQDPPSPSTPFIPPTEVASGPPTTAFELFTHPERRFSFTMEAQLLFPVIHQHLQAPITVPGFYSDTAHLPFTDQGLAGAIALGVRMKALGGELGFTYRYLASEGNTTLSNFDPLGAVPFRSRLDMNNFDFDYFTRDYDVYPRWLVRGDAGVRLATAFFDMQAFGFQYDRQISNHFVGAGPHLGLHLMRILGDSGVAIMGRIDAGTLFGDVHQQFRDTVFDGNGTALGFGYTSQRVTRGVPVLVAELGFGAAPGNRTWGQWQVGYQFEQWWSIGTIGASTADLVNQGMYARWVFSY